MKILLLLIVVTFTYSIYLKAQTKTSLLPKYSITVVEVTNVSVVKNTVLGKTVEHYTSYVNENEYTIRINVNRNEITNIPDSTLTLECFFSEQLVTTIVVNLNNVEWLSEDNFSYSFPLVAEKNGWVYLCISTPSEFTHESWTDRYRQLKLNRRNSILYLDALKK